MSLEELKVWKEQMEKESTEILKRAFRKGCLWTLDIKVYDRTFLKNDQLFKMTWIRIELSNSNNVLRKCKRNLKLYLVKETDLSEVQWKVQALS